jgi:hypothetical protein
MTKVSPYLCTEAIKVMDAAILHTLDHARALLGIAHLHQELLTTLGNFIKPFQMNCRFCHKSGLVILLFRFDLICMHGNFSNAFKDSLYLEQCFSRLANHL